MSTQHRTARTLNRFHTAALAVVFACAASSSLQAAVTLSLPKLEAKTGHEIEVPIAAKGAKGMSGLQMRLVFDPAVLELVQDPNDPAKTLTRGKILPENAIAQAMLGKKNPERLAIVFVSGVNQSQRKFHAVEEDGTLVTLRFKVIGAGGQKSPLKLEEVQAFQISDIDMLVKSEAGEVAVSSSFPWWWLLALVPLLLLILVVIVLLTRRKR